MKRGTLHQKDGSWYLSLRKTIALGKITEAEATQEQAAICGPCKRVNSKEDLIQWHEMMIVRLNARTLIDGGEMNLRGSWPRFCDSPRRRECGQETLMVYRGQWVRFFTYGVRRGLHRLSDVTPSHAEAYCKTLNHGTMVASTYNKHVGLLKMVFKVLRVTPNPWEEIPMKRVQHKKHRALSNEEVKTLIGKAPASMKPLLMLGYYTGLRLKDCALLKWSDVDLSSGLIRVDTNKTGQRITVPIHKTLLEALEGVYDPRLGNVLPLMFCKYTSYSGALSKAVQKLFKNCDIKGDDRGSVGFHSFRHTFVSMLRASGVAQSTTQGLVGHKSAAMTDYYSHCGEAESRAAVERLPEL